MVYFAFKAKGKGSRPRSLIALKKNKIGENAIFDNCDSNLLLLYNVLHQNFP